MNFRKAQENDIPAIVEMLANDDLGILRECFETPLPADYYVAFNNICGDNNQELIVVEDADAKIVGTLQLSFIQYLTYQGGIRAQIEGVRVRKGKRDSGLGKEMVKWAIERAKQRGAHLVQLTTDKKRPKAIRFYEALGFKPSHEGMKLHFK